VPERNLALDKRQQSDKKGKSKVKSSPQRSPCGHWQADAKEEKGEKGREEQVPASGPGAFELHWEFQALVFLSCRSSLSKGFCMVFC